MLGLLGLWFRVFWAFWSRVMELLGVELWDFRAHGFEGLWQSKEACRLRFVLLTRPQRLQYPLIKEYTLNCSRILNNMI